MTSGRWATIESLFHEAKGLAADARHPFLIERCRGDSDLCAQIEALLTADQIGDGFLESAVSEAASAFLDDDQPARIGPYSILRKLGQGGMGTVYLAARADDQYRKHVAIKLIRAGWDAPEMVLRFRTERQILADLEHPGIARLLDGGATPSGSPYVVLEYVDGIPIDAFCRNRNLSVAGRLQLFRQVCAAVSYAHRNLVVHRDIKPGNILVTSEGQPKLLDFGVAKLLSADRAATRLCDQLLTPEYASPEQIRGEAVNTGSDVYSLGVLLYELLTEVQPFQLKDKSATERERVICTVMPEKPSAVAHGRELASDLDSIVLKALRKESARRYQSVDELSLDIQRYLDGRPVLAAPDTWTYRSHKFVRRHWLLLSALLIVLLMLSGALALIASAERRAETARARAQSRFQTILAMADSSLFEIDESIRMLPGSTKSRSLLVRRALQYLDLLARDNASDPALERELARAYEKLSDIQFRNGPGRIGDSSGALASGREALRLRRKLASESPNSSTLSDVAADLSRLAEIERLERTVTASIRDFQAAQAIYEQLQTTDPTDLRLLRGLGEADQGLGDAERNSGRSADAITNIRKASMIWEKLYLASPQDPIDESGLLVVSLSLADLYFRQNGDFPAALQYAERALTIARKLNKQMPGNTEYTTDLASALNRLGLIYTGMHQPAKALTVSLESAAIIDSLARSDPADARLRRSVAVHIANVAIALDSLGRLPEAEARYRRALSIHGQLAQHDPHSQQVRDDYSYVQVLLGSLLVRTGRVSQGIQEIRTALVDREKLVAGNPENVELRSRLAQAYDEFGKAEAASAHWEQARQAYEKSAGLLASLQGQLALGDQREQVARQISECRRKSLALSTGPHSRLH